MPDIIVAMLYIFGGLAVVTAITMVPVIYFLDKLEKTSKIELPEASVGPYTPWYRKILRLKSPISVRCVSCDADLGTEFDSTCVRCVPKVKVHAAGWEWTVDEDKADRLFTGHKKTKVE